MLGPNTISLIDTVSTVTANAHHSRTKQSTDHDLIVASLHLDISLHGSGLFRRECTQEGTVSSIPYYGIVAY